MDADRLFLDTNVLIYATDERVPLQPVALATIQSARDAGTALVISQQIVRESLAVATRPAAAGGGSILGDVMDNVGSFRSAFVTLVDSPAVLDQLLILLRTIPGADRRVYDTNIVATMLVYGVSRLLTHNVSDFARFASLITIVPLVSGDATV